MDAKRRLTIYLEPWVIDVLKLDALLAHSTMSARVRAVIEAHAKVLQLTQPRSMFTAHEREGYAQ